MGDGKPCIASHTANLPSYLLGICTFTAAHSLRGHSLRKYDMGAQVRKSSWRGSFSTGEHDNKGYGALFSQEPACETVLVEEGAGSRESERKGAAASVL